MSLQEQSTQLGQFKTSVEDLALEELSRLQEDERDILASLNRVRAEIKTVRAILMAARPTSTKPPKKASNSPKSGGSRPFKMGPEKRAEIIAVITGNDEELTSSRVSQLLPHWSVSYIGFALKELREEGALRLAAQSGGTNIYRSMI